MAHLFEPLLKIYAYLGNDTQIYVEGTRRCMFQEIIFNAEACFEQIALSIAWSKTPS